MWPEARVQIDPPSDKPIILQEHTDWVHALAFSPDSEILVSGSADRTVRRWKIIPKHLVDEVCAVVARRLTQEEWERFVGTDIPYSTYEPCPENSR